MAEENGMTVDEKTLIEEQNKAKENSRMRKGTKGDIEPVTLDVHVLDELEKNRKIPKTNDSFKYSKMSGLRF